MAGTFKAVAEWTYYTIENRYWDPLCHEIEHAGILVIVFQIDGGIVVSCWLTVTTSVGATGSGDVACGAAAVVGAKDVLVGNRSGHRHICCEE